jgi:hypothetical protein
MKTTIDMAREAGVEVTYEYEDGDLEWGCSTEQLKAFAALVRADEREQGQKWFDAVTAQHKQLILAEREACAKVCYELPWKDMGHIPSNLAFAAAIRNRGNT